MPGRLGLSDRGLDTGKLARLHRIRDRRGPASDRDGSLRFVDRLREILAKHPSA